MGPSGGQLIVHHQAGREAEYDFDTTHWTDEWTMGGQTARISIWRRPLHAMIEVFTGASARKVMADVITQQGLEAAQVVMTEGLTQAAEQGLKRPTAAQLEAIAKGLAAPSIPQQAKGPTAAEPAAKEPQVAAAITSLERAASALRERVHSALTPASVRAALEADPVAAREHVEDLEAELERVAKRPAARRAIASAPEEAAV